MPDESRVDETIELVERLHQLPINFRSVHYSDWSMMMAVGEVQPQRQLSLQRVALQNIADH